MSETMKNVEVEINPLDGALYVRPRNISPVLSVDAYFALENIGVDTLNRFTKKHFKFQLMKRTWVTRSLYPQVEN